jgi:hypothetical protein
MNNILKCNLNKEINKSMMFLTVLVPLFSMAHCSTASSPVIKVTLAGVARKVGR